MTGCADRAEQHVPVRARPPGPDQVLTGSIVGQIDSGITCPAQPPAGYGKPDDTAGSVTKLGSAGMLALALPQSIPSWGSVKPGDEVMEKEVFFGPAKATMQLPGQDQQVSYVPSGWIGYVEFRKHGGVYCRMISSEATEAGRKLWSIKGQSDVFWYRFRYPSTYRPAE